MPVWAQPLALNPLKDMSKVDELDYTADFDNLYSKIDDLEKFFNNGKLSYSMLKYIPDLAKVGYQGQLYLTETKRKYAMTLTKTRKL